MKVINDTNCNIIKYVIFFLIKNINFSILINKYILNVRLFLHCRCIRTPIVATVEVAHTDILLVLHDI